ncbi:MAG: patatin-like phospholipase family protein [Planctomycetes bacterium]|nr:patatin-like phospholipase family protein [Planctomycetota bacterium]
MGGGGARAAYQVGVLRAIARHQPRLTFPILTGVSAGAINTAFMANAPGDFAQRTERLSGLWSNLTTEQVFRSDSLSLFRTAAKWGVRLVSGASRLAARPRGMVDTEPLRAFLKGALSSDDGKLRGVADNLRTGLQAVGITTTDYASGRSVTFVQSNGAPRWQRPHRESVAVELTVEHVMASAALPIFFPAIRLGEEWHGDGGIGLTAPLSPALHLGADRILAISTRFERTHYEPSRPLGSDYPPPAQIVGAMLNAVFLDMLDQDAMNLDRINRLIVDLPPERRMGLRPAHLMMLRPSRNISALAGQFEARLPQPFRFLLRGTGTKETKSPESLSMVMFEPSYTKAVMDMGSDDAEKRMPELLAFLEGEQRPGLQSTGFWRV